MKVLIVGTGPIGLTTGACLLKSGNNISFLSNMEDVITFTEKPLQTSGIIGEYSFKLDIHENTGFIKKADLIIFDLRAGEYLPDAISSSENTILVLKEGMVQDNLPGTPIYGLAYLSAEVNDNRLKVNNLEKLIIGTTDNSNREKINELAEFLNNNAINTLVTEDLSTEKWIKLEWDAAFNAISAVENITVKEILSNSETRARAVRLMVETARTGKAEGIRFPDNLVNMFLKNSFEMDYKSSMCLDIEKGRVPDYEGINGFIIRTAEKYRLRVPENQKIYDQLKLIMNDK